MNKKTFSDAFLDLNEDIEPTPDECRADLRAAGYDPDALTASVLSRLRVLLGMETLDEQIHRAMVEMGWLLPTTPEEVELAENQLDAEEAQ